MFYSAGAWTKKTHATVASGFVDMPPRLHEYQVGGCRGGLWGLTIQESHFLAMLNQLALLAEAGEMLIT